MNWNRKYVWMCLGAALTAMLCYSLAGFFLAPVWLERSLVRQVREQSGLQADIEQLGFNPYTLALEVRGLELRDEAGTPLLALAAGYLNLDVTGLPRGVLVVRRLELRQPRLSIAVYGPGDTSLTRLLSRRETEDEPPALPAVELRQAIISAGVMEFTDRTAAAPRQVLLERIEVSMRELSTLPGGMGEFQLGIGAIAGGQLAISGSIDLAARTSTGTYRIEAIDLEHVNGWLPGDAGAWQLAGRVTLAGDYRVVSVPDGVEVRLAGGHLAAVELRADGTSGESLRLPRAAAGYELSYAAAGDAPRWTFAAADIEADGFSLLAEASGEPLLVLDRIRLDTARLDPEERGIRLGELVLEGGAARIHRGPGDAAGWSGMLPVPGAAQTQADPGDEAPWVIRTGRISATGLGVEFTDATLPEPVVWRVDGVELQAANLGTAPGEQGEFSLGMNIDGGGRLEGAGWVIAAQPALQAEVLLTGFDTTALDPYLRQYSILALASGSLSARLQAGYASGVFSLGGTLEGGDFLFADRSSGEVAARLGGFTASGLSIRSDPQVATVERLTLVEPYLRIDIDPDRRLNLSAWFGSTPAEAPVVDGESVPEAPSSVNTDPPPSVAPALEIGRIGIRAGQAEFSDRSLAPNFSVTLADLTGDVTGFSLEPERSIAMELEGRINEFGVSRINGRLRPFDSRRYSEVNMNLGNIDTAMLSPYAARFAGREIASGRMNLDLRYLVQDGELQGSHDIEFTDLILGDRVESPQARDLPLDLALALLRDRQGRISISIPVTGNLENPEFDIRSVIGKAFGNLITGLVGAPFKLLGALAGGGDAELDTIPFDAGSAAISPPARERIIELGAALEQRPALALRVNPAYHPQRDRDALARQQMRQHVALAAGLEEAGRAQSGPLAFGDPKIQDVLEEFAGTRLGVEEKSRLTADRDAAVAEDAERYYEGLFNALVAAEEIPVVNLERVATYRAAAVVEQLVGSGVAPERVQKGDEIRVAGTDERSILLELSALPLR